MTPDLFFNPGDDGHDDAEHDADSNEHVRKAPKEHSDDEQQSDDLKHEEVSVLGVVEGIFFDGRKGTLFVPHTGHGLKTWRVVEKAGGPSVV